MLYDRQHTRGEGECGGKGSIILPPYAMFFKSSCALHDESYGIGGNEEDRIKADVGFLRAMLQDCERINNSITKKYYIFWAHLYFVAVRLYGAKYFKYADNCQTRGDF